MAKAKSKKPPVDDAARTLELPPLPTYVFTALGEVSVTLVESIPDDHGKPGADLGACDFHKRFIQIRADMSLATQWTTLYHEQAHYALWDAGVKLSHRNEEAVCDAIALQRFQEMVTRR